MLPVDTGASDRVAGGSPDAVALFGVHGGLRFWVFFTGAGLHFYQRRRRSVPGNKLHLARARPGV